MYCKACSPSMRRSAATSGAALRNASNVSTASSSESSTTRISTIRRMGRAPYYLIVVAIQRMRCPQRSHAQCTIRRARRRARSWRGNDPSAESDGTAHCRLLVLLTLPPCSRMLEITAHAEKHYVALLRIRSATCDGTLARRNDCVEQLKESD